jgi:hypothetical protein
MAEAIRRDCDPVFFGLGFRNPGRSDPDRWGGTTRRNLYVRWRGTDYDEIELQWDKYSRPKFFLNFMTSRIERPPRDAGAALRAVRFGDVRPWRGPILLLLGGWFGPWLSPDGVARLVNRRVPQVNDYMLRGHVGSYMTVTPPILRGPDDGDERVPPRMKIWGDPWLDPESDYAPKDEFD